MICTLFLSLWMFLLLYCWQMGLSEVLSKRTLEIEPGGRQYSVGKLRPSTFVDWRPLVRIFYLYSGRRPQSSHYRRFSPFWGSGGFSIGEQNHIVTRFYPKIYYYRGTTLNKYLGNWVRKSPIRRWKAKTLYFRGKKTVCPYILFVFCAVYTK